MAVLTYVPSGHRLTENATNANIAGPARGAEASGCALKNDQLAPVARIASFTVRLNPFLS
jgi:hypothetical protein